MKQDRISTRQLGALLWAGLMAPAAELLPAVTLPLAGAGSLAVRFGGPASGAADRVDADQAGSEPGRPGRSGLPGDGAVGRQRGAPSLYDMGGAAAGPAPAPVRPAPADRWGAGRLPVVFSACGGGAGFVDGPGEAVGLCPGGTVFFGGAADRSGGRTPPLPASDGGGTSAAHLVGGSAQCSQVGAARAGCAGLWGVRCVPDGRSGDGAPPDGIGGSCGAQGAVPFWRSRRRW